MPFTIYDDFESILKGVKRNDKINNISYAEKYQDHIPCSFAYKIICMDDKFTKPVVLYRGKMYLINLLKQCLKK